MSELRSDQRTPQYDRELISGGELRWLRHELPSRYSADSGSLSPRPRMRRTGRVVILFGLLVATATVVYLLWQWLKA